MRETLEKVIKSNNNGLFLLDPPTGFGKTTVVVDLIRRFLKGDPLFSNVKKIFFFTNLKTNLPFSAVLEGLESEEKEKCFQARAVDECVIDRLLEVEITIDEIKYSKELKTLKSEVEAYRALKDTLEEEIDETKRERIIKSLKILERKIAGDTEPAFRKFLKSRFFYNKSIQEKKKFVDENPWFRSLYPIANIEKYKVVFLTTKRFALPIDTFKRLPFYLYNDDITKNSIVFMDEFDATKQTLLGQIVDDGLKSKIDIIKLFLDLHFALQNFVIPKKLLKSTDYHKEKEKESADGKPWHTTEEHFNYWRSAFDNIYKENDISYLLKSVDFEYDRAFLFDDGRYFNVVKDSSKKFLYTFVDKKEDFLALRGCDYDGTKNPINGFLRSLEGCIDGFTRSIFYIANNFMYYKNSGKKDYEIKYTQEEAVYTVLDALNLNDEEKRYLFEKIQMGDFSFEKPDQDKTMRRGFNFTEVEDSNYHDIKSVVHSYKFHTTPEDILIKLAEKSLVVGISATAKVNTCIGNYDLPYLRKKLKETFVYIDKEDEDRIADSFSDMLEETNGKYKIHTRIVDDFAVFSDKEKCEVIINNIFKDTEYKNKYCEILTEPKLNTYYFLIELKLASIYLDMKQKRYKSFIGFLNSFPKKGGDFNYERLMGLLSDIDGVADGISIRKEIVDAGNYDYKFKSIYEDLDKGNAVFVLTTYQTIGSGKNIQYKIPEIEKDNIVYCNKDERGEKDFDAIFLLTPTNLLQLLSFYSENRHSDLAKYLFQQEYLYQNGYLTYSEMKHNIANGFRKVFFSDEYSSYLKNGDLYDNTLRLVIQAVGRICRCRNKNKNIYIYTDKEVIERVQYACSINQPRLLNEEFRSLLNYNLSNVKMPSVIEKYSRQSKRAFLDITKSAYTVRNSRKNVFAWQDLRDFVLKNPTADFVPQEYIDYYFDFNDKYSGYSYKYGKGFDITDIKMDTRYGDMKQVSDQAADLPLILSCKTYLEELFDSNKYAKEFAKKRFIMSPSLFKQVYLGALGEVVGREIIAQEVALDLEELDDISFYEYFDFKIGNLYFDFKHWDEFRTDATKYAQKVKRKLNKIQGAKCFIVNIVKRTDAKPVESVDETIIQIPYLIDGDKGTINNEAIDYILDGTV